MDAPTSKYWLDQITADISQAFPEGELTVASGVSPSGPYHVGHLREMLTADALTYNLRKSGRQARHLHFVDDFDILRKLPAGVEDSYAEHLGKPLYLAPDPHGCHDGYADHYLTDFLEALAPLRLDMEVVRSHQQYRSGKFAEAIEQILSRVDDIRGIIGRVSGRQLDEVWVPVQILSDNGRLNEWVFTGWDQEKGVVRYHGAQGEDGELEYGEGRVKLDWRLDWPARWSIWGVDAEPFGRDHAAKGGSYDTGQVLVTEIFDGRAPYPVPYEFINPVGETKKMSASAGTGITPADALDIMPPEILRYFVLKSRPAKTLQFDAGTGLYNLIEEYSKVEEAVRAGESHEFARAYQIASGETQEQTISSVPFTHMVASYQAVRGDLKALSEALERTGYGKAVKAEKGILEREIRFVEHWLKHYAPEEVKFELQQELPQIELSREQQGFLDSLAAQLEQAGDLEGQAVHNLVYECLQKQGIKPQEAFQAIYRVLLGQDSGPKAGWFLASLERPWLVERLKREG